MNSSDFPFLRYLPFFLSGVFFSKIFPEFRWLIFFIGALVLWFAYLLIIRKKSAYSIILSGNLAYSQLFFLGCALGLQKVDVYTPSLDWQGVDSYLAEVTEYDVPKANSTENLLEVFALRAGGDWVKANGKVLIYHQSPKSLQPGDILFVKKTPETIPSPSFPDEFDYREFLAKKGIHFRHRIKNDFLKLDSTGIENSRFLLDRIGNSLAQLIHSNLDHPESRQIALALLLGQKGSLEKEIRDAYSETGTMHILAVSGLHVGIIYAILLLPVRGLRSTSKIRFFYLFLVIFLIWVYALLTGFSPSVVRAAAMFSLMTFGQMRKRKASIWNTLAFSALMILVTDPDVIFDIGFQLSYLAVAGIVGIQPLMVGWWFPRNSILEYFWQLATVSLAAQLVTFPLSILYFHQFPTYFLIANLLVVPLAFVIMAVGVPFLFLAWIPTLGVVLGWIVNWLIYFQNQLTAMIQVLPFGTIERLTITVSGILFLWGMLLIWGNWEMGNRKRLVFLGISLFAIWRGEALIKEILRLENQLIPFKNQKGILLDLRIGDHFLCWNQNFPIDQISFSINPNRIVDERSDRPIPLKGIPQDSAIWFPGLEFQFFPKNGEIQWIRKDQKIVMR